jgi:hypothetical protein
MKKLTIYNLQFTISSQLSIFSCVLLIASLLNAESYKLKIAQGDLL